MVATTMGATVHTLPGSSGNQRTGGVSSQGAATPLLARQKLAVRYLAVVQTRGLTQLYPPPPGIPIAARAGDPLMLWRVAQH